MSTLPILSFARTAIWAALLFSNACRILACLALINVFFAATSAQNRLSSVLHTNSLSYSEEISTAYAIFDTAFNGTGFRADDFASESMAIQADGKIVVVGARLPGLGAGFSVIRVNPDGSLDTTFGGDGEILTVISEGYRAHAVSVAVQSDGKIVVLGNSGPGSSPIYWTLVRYNSDSSLDATFGTDGKVLTVASPAGGSGARSLAIQPDGKIVVAGNADGMDGDFAVGRYNANGSLDTTWNGDGIAFTSFPSSMGESARSVKIQPDGKVIVAGWVFTQVTATDFALVRFNSDGTLDTTFGGSGKVTTSFLPQGADFANSIALQPDGKIVAAGSASNDVVFVRYKTDGSLDTTFGNGGKVIVKFPVFRTKAEVRSLTILPSGKILGGGRAFIWNGGTHMAFVRLNGDGTLDRSFDRDGIATLPIGFTSGDVRDMHLDDQGRIVSTGFSHIAARTIEGPGIFGNATPFDFDGDGRADLSVWRPSNNTWYIQTSQGMFAQEWGQDGDKIVPADYDRDGKDDLAVFRPSNTTWYIIESSTNSVRTAIWGQTDDLPVPADLSGDGRADLVTYGTANRAWSVRSLYGSGHVTEQFGAVGDKPVRGDFDGDLQSDIAVYRPSDHKWIIEKPFLREIVLMAWGEDGDIPVPADYDGDGTTDIAVWRPSTGEWWIVGSSSGWAIYRWGVPGDRPVPADYDGDGRADVAIFRPSNSTWYIVRSSEGIWVRPFGEAGDVPIPSAFQY